MRKTDNETTSRQDSGRPKTGARITARTEPVRVADRGVNHDVVLVLAREEGHVVERDAQGKGARKDAVPGDGAPHDAENAMRLFLWTDASRERLQDR